MTRSPLTPVVPASVVTAVDHVGIAVPDLDAALAGDAGTLGLVATPLATNEEQGVREAMLSVPRRHRRGRAAPRPPAAGLPDREVHRPQRPRDPAGGLPGRRHRRRVR